MFFRKRDKVVLTLTPQEARYARSILLRWRNKLLNAGKPNGGCGGTDPEAGKVIQKVQKHIVIYGGSLVKIYKAPSYHNNSAMYRGR